ncbi:MAG: Gfo/Idh/MocA family oxidoreductase [Treponema sp.]|nr:Gfo/Idh/MocA family oxidoreductase [Treponema sp.]
MAKYKWGILGPGMITHKFTAGLKVTPDAELYAVGSRDLGRAEAFAKQHGFAKAYGSYQELVEDKELDIVYVATPHPQHEEAALLCLKHGKGVICEKPFAVNTAQTRRMIDCARSQGVFLMEAMWTRFLPAICKVRELLAEDAIGQVRHVYSGNGFRTEVRPESRLFSLAYGGGALLDMGIYNLSFCSMIFGKAPARIQSQISIGSTGVDEECSALFSYDEHQSAQLYTAIRVANRHGALILGEKGSIYVPNFGGASSLTLQNQEGTKELEFPYEATGYQFEAQEVMRCLDEGLKESAVMPLDETLAIIQTMDQIRKQNGLRYPCDEEG